MAPLRARCSPNARGPGRPHGQALVESALVLPLLVVLLLFSVFLVDLLLAKAKLREASRLGAWELTTHPLGQESTDEDASETSAASAQRAAASVVEGLTLRYAQLDPLSPHRPFGFAATFERFSAEVEWLPPSVPDATVRVQGGLRPHLAVLGRSVGTLAASWGFEGRGLAQVTTRGQLHNRLLPVRYLQRGHGGFFHRDVMGDHALTQLPLHDRFTLLVNDWHLSDGLDANIVPGRAGVHLKADGVTPGAKSGLYRQVERMRYFGISEAARGLPALRGGGMLARLVGSPGPDSGGTFVVSHGYRANAPGTSRGCPEGGKSHPAQAGESNLAVTRSDPAAPGVESLHTDGEGPLLRCFDTAPFREQQVFDRSPYVRIFEARGEHFMGCKHAMAEDVSHAVDAQAPDRFTAKVNCE